MAHLLFLTERFPPESGGLARSAGRMVHSLTQLGMTVEVVTWSRYLQPGEVKLLGSTIDSEGKLFSPFPQTPERNLTSLLHQPSMSSHQPQETIQRFSVHTVGRYRHWDMTMPHTITVLNCLHAMQPFDAVWGHYVFPSGFLAVWFAQLHHLPSLVSVRGNDIDRALFPPGDFARLHWTLTHADQLTAVSQDMANKVQIVSDRPAIVQKNVVDTAIFHPHGDHGVQASLRHQLGLAPNEVVLGFSGELREKKGQSFLLQALTRVRVVRPACLLIVGDVRSDSQAVIQAYASAHAEDAARLIITGHLPTPHAVAQHLRLCDVFLQPSLWDGMPNALLEAMACGCVCIASDAGGIPEVLTHGETGFVLPQIHLHHLGDAILEYLALEEAQQQHMAIAANQHIQPYYALDQEHEQLQ